MPHQSQLPRELYTREPDIALLDQVFPYFSFATYTYSYSGIKLEGDMAGPNQDI